MLLIIFISIISIYLIVVGLYYFKRSSSATKYCNDKHAGGIAWDMCPAQDDVEVPLEYTDCFKEIYEKAEIDAELFSGATDKGYSLLTTVDWSGSGTAEDPYKDPTRGNEDVGFFAPDGFAHWWEKADDGVIIEDKKEEFLQKTVSDYERFYSACNTLAKASLYTIFSLGVLMKKPCASEAECEVGPTKLEPDMKGLFFVPPTWSAEQEG